MSASPVALEFVRFVLRQNPGATEFTTLYDAMARTAAARSFQDLGYRELAEVGVSFSLLATDRLEALIKAGRAAEATARPS
jgi:hypothetical protein